MYVRDKEKRGGREGKERGKLVKEGRRGYELRDHITLSGRNGLVL